MLATADEDELPLNDESFPQLERDDMYAGSHMHIEQVVHEGIEPVVKSEPHTAAEAYQRYRLNPTSEPQGLAEGPGDRCGVSAIFPQPDAREPAPVGKGQGGRMSKRENLEDQHHGCQIQGCEESETEPYEIEVNVWTGQEIGTATADVWLCSEHGDV